MAEQPGPSLAEAVSAAAAAATTPDAAKPMNEPPPVEEAVTGHEADAAATDAMAPAESPATIPAEGCPRISILNPLEARWDAIPVYAFDVGRRTRSC